MPCTLPAQGHQIRCRRDNVYVHVHASNLAESSVAESNTSEFDVAGSDVALSVAAEYDVAGS